MKNRHVLVVVLVLLGAAGLGLAAQQQQEIQIVGGGPLPPGIAGAGGMQPMGSGSGVIFGQVTESESNRPVSGALVTLNLTGSQPIRVMADAQGRFGFRDLPKGRFNVTATRPGWVDGGYGRTRPGGPALPIALEDGEKISGVNVPMWRFATITGTIVDEAGDPLVGKMVHVLKRSIVGGKIRLVQGPMDSTDDRGVFRVGMLEPGDYVVAVPMDQSGMAMSMDGPATDFLRREMVEVRAAAAAGAGRAMTFFNADEGTAAGMTEDGRWLAYPTVFYPTAVTATKATIIKVASGDERTAIDFRLKAVTTSKVSGTVMGPEGPSPNLQVMLAPAEADDLVSNFETLAGFSDNQGRFTINGVPPGQYVLRAVRSPRMAMGPAETVTMQQGGNVMVFRSSSANLAAPLPTEPTYWTEMSVSVGSRDLTELTVGLRPGVKVTGMVQFNGGAERPASDRLPSIGLSLESADVRPGLTTNGRGRVDPSGQFSTVGVPPGKYFIRVAGAPAGWTFHSAMVNGRDASVTPIELEGGDVSGVVIAFTDKPSQLTGDVTVDSGAP